MENNVQTENKKHHNFTAKLIGSASKAREVAKKAADVDTGKKKRNVP